MSDRSSGREVPPRNHFRIERPSPGRTYGGVGHARAIPERRTGWIEFAVEAVTPIHVGAGTYAERDGRLVKACVRRSGTPVVPGTSVKGAVRMVLEAITGSRDPFNEPGKLEGARSIAGDMFGAMGYRGRFSFSDAVPDELVATRVYRISTAYPPNRNAPPGRRFYGPMPAGAVQPPAVPVEAIPPDTMLFTRMHFESASREELGAALTAMGLWPVEASWETFHLRLGGGRYHELGWAMFRPGPYLLDDVTDSFGLRCGPVVDEGAIEAFVLDALAAFRPAGEGAAALEQFKTRMRTPDPAPREW